MTYTLDQGGEHWKRQDHVDAWAERKAALSEERAIGFQHLLDALPGDTEAHLRILDLGAGDGTVAGLLLERFPNAMAELVDFSEPMMEEGRRSLAMFEGRFRYHFWDMSIGPFPEALTRGAPFDAIVSGAAIHHLVNDRKGWIVEESHRLTRPGGIFANYDLYRDPDATFGPDEGHNAACATLAEASDHLERAGYHDVEILARVPRPARRTEMALMLGRA